MAVHGANFAGLSSDSTKLLCPRDQQHNLALRWMGLIMCKKLAGGAAAEFLEFLCQLARDAKLSLRHDIDAGGECFR